MGEHIILVDLLESIPGSSSQVRSTQEPHAEIAERALVSFVRPDQSLLGEQDSQSAPHAVKRKKAKKVRQIKAAGTGLEGLRGLGGPNL